MPYYFYYGKYMKVDEPEKTTGPSGVIPIAVLKKESTIVCILLSI
jgi:hypothetical protein